MLWKKLCAVVCCLWVCCVGFAQTPAFRNYNTANGLPSSETYCALQDSKGYMWFGTDRGLVKFDGYSFQTLTTAEGMPDNTVFGLQKDHQNRIWFNTFSSRMGYLSSDSVGLYAHNRLLKSCMPTEVMQSWKFDHKNSLWVSYTFNASGSERFATFKINADGKIDSSLSNYTKNTLKLYVASNSCFASGPMSAQNVEVIDLGSGTLLGQTVLSENTRFCPRICQLKNGDLWIGINHSLFRIQNKTFRKVLDLGSNLLTLRSDAHNNLWIGLLNQGVVALYRTDNYSTPQKLLPKYSVSDIATDREGGLWFTTLENGIYYLPPERPCSYSEPDGLSSPKVRKVVNIDKNILMILSNEDIYLKKVGHSDFHLFKKRGMGLNDISYMPPHRIFYSGKQPMAFPFPNKKSILLKNMIIDAGKKFIWSSGYSQIIRCDTNGKILEEIPFYSISRITCQLETDSASVFFGTLDGLFLYQNGKALPMKKYNLLYGNRISQMQQLDSATLVIATMGQGILLVRNNNWAHPIQYTVAHGLNSNMCRTIFCDHDSIIWVGTNRGLCRITNPMKSNKVHFRKIDLSDGLISNEINHICNDGDTLWLSTMGGVTVIPKWFGNKKMLDIPVYIEKVLVNGEAVNALEKKPFAYNQNNVSFSFTGLNFQFAGKLFYKYRLIGSETNWSYTLNRSIIYKNLAPGNYTFQFKPLGINREETSNLATYSFTIQAPWWQTWWFISSCFIGALLVIYLFVQNRVRIARARLQLENDLNSFREKAMRAQMNPHFVYNSLNSIQNFILQHDSLASVSFLSKFSLLMRLTFNNSNAEMVPLEKDLEALKLYTELENLRFADKFSLRIEVDKNIDAFTTFLPPLLIQPFVENAILHGIMSKKEHGLIHVQISKTADRLHIVITDNGVGRQQAARIKERKEKYGSFGGKPEKNENSGIQTTITRIEQTWRNQPGKSEFNILDLQDEQGIPSGTSVSFYLPLHYD